MPLKINIYQINTDRDPKQLKFLCLDTARRILHSAEPDSAAYDKVYSGDGPYRRRHCPAPQNAESDERCPDTGI